MDINDFGTRLKRAIELANLNQKELSEKIGVSKTSINNYAQGRIPEAKILYKISRECNVTIDWLLTGEGEPSPQNQPITPITTTETPETIMLLKIYNSLDEKKQHLALQKVLEIANSKD